TATIWVKDPEPDRIRPTMRRTSSVVFPVPAAASTKKLVSNSLEILSRARRSLSSLMADPAMPAVIRYGPEAFLPTGFLHMGRTRCDACSTCRHPAPAPQAEMDPTALRLFHRRFAPRAPECCH